MKGASPNFTPADEWTFFPVLLFLYRTYNKPSFVFLWSLHLIKCISRFDLSVRLHADVANVLKKPIKFADVDCQDLFAKREMLKMSCSIYL